MFSKLVDEEVWSQAKFIFNSNKKHIRPHTQTKIKKQRHKKNNVIIICNKMK